MESYDRLPQIQLTVLSAFKLMRCECPQSPVPNFLYCLSYAETNFVFFAEKPSEWNEDKRVSVKNYSSNESRKCSKNGKRKSYWNNCGYLEKMVRCVKVQVEDLSVITKFHNHPISVFNTLKEIVTSHIYGQETIMPNGDVADVRACVRACVCACVSVYTYMFMANVLLFPTDPFRGI